MSSIALPLTDIVDVNVSAAAPPVAAKNFNQGLIIGDSAVIPTYGANARLRQYANLAEMLTDGFIDTEPEYLAAELYFEQSEPASYVWVGRQDLTAIATGVVDAGGTSYVVGDIVTVVQSGGSQGQFQVATVSSGVVTGITLVAGQQGTGYAAASGLATTGGTGTGLTITITIGETLLQAAERCQLANQSWYAFMACGAIDSDHIALGAWSTANWQNVMYFGASATTAIAAGTSGNVALAMQAAKYRAFLLYSTTQGGNAPNNAYAAGGILGLAMGLNTGAPGSAFTLAGKSVIGVIPEPITQTQYTTITSANCNVVASFGPYIGLCETGILSSGEFFDQILYRAMLVNLIQTNLMNLLTSVPKIPQTDPGEHQLIVQVNASCQTMATLGYLAGGTWKGQTVQLSPTQTLITNGQAIPSGFLVGAPSYQYQSSGNRQARQAQPIYAAILEAGAVNSVVVNVNTQL